MNQSRKSGCATLFWGLLLIGLGAWFFLENLGYNLPGLGRLWPVFPMLGGFALVVSYFTGERRNPAVLVPGLGAFLFGLFFLLITYGPLRWSNLGNLWPIFPTLGGVVFIGLFLADRKDFGALIPGVMSLLTGIFFFLFTVGPFNWYQMGRLWPAFPTIGGLAFLVAWLADRESRGLLAVGTAGVATGILGFFVTFGSLTFAWIEKGWPLLLIAVGGYLLFQALTGRRPRDSAGRID